MINDKIIPSLNSDRIHRNPPRKSHSTDANALFLKPIFVTDENEIENNTDVFTRLYRTQTKSSHIRFQHSNSKPFTSNNTNKNQLKNRSKSMNNIRNEILPKIDINHNQITWNNLSNYFNPSSEFFDKLLQPESKNKEYSEEIDFSRKIWQWLYDSESHLDCQLK